MGSELEFYLLKDDYAAAYAKGYRDLVPTQHYVEDYHILSGTRVEGRRRRESVPTSTPRDRRGVQQGEWGPGQHEINLRYAGGARDGRSPRALQARAKEIAARGGPLAHVHGEVRRGLAGSSLPVHASLWSEVGESAFAGARPLAAHP
jgi:glutamine synthetase